MIVKNIENQRNKKLVWHFWSRLQEAPESAIGDVVATAMAPDVKWFGPDPINNLTSADSFVENFWRPLRQSFPDLTRETFIFYGGESNGRKDGDISKDGKTWVTGTGVFTGTFSRDYLGIPATGNPIKIRWGDFSRIENGKIVEVYFLIDLIDLMQQAGYQVLPPSLGEDGQYKAPAAGDGILLDEQDPHVSNYTLGHMRRFIFEGLNKFDEQNLESMGMENFFHPDITWYGPGGIGCCYGLNQFEDFHQKPWLSAYPDREVQDLDAIIAEGAYSGAPGWAGVIATHTGDYKGIKATGSTIKFNGLDWWKRDGDQLVENWVFVDMIHLFKQFGVDLIARLHEQQTVSV